jgi:HK97 family phage major capsid protein
MPTLVDKLSGELVATLTPLRDLAETAEKDNRALTDAERETVRQGMAKAQDIKKRLQDAKGDNELRDAIGALGDGIGLVDADAERKSREQQLNGNTSGLIIPAGGKSLGEYFTESEPYTDLLKTVPGGHFSKEHRVQGRPVGYKNLLRPSMSERGQKTLVTGVSDTSAGVYVQNDLLGTKVGLDAFTRPLRLRDLVTSGRTTSDTVEYVRLTSITNNAATVAEATTAALPTQNGSTGPLINNAGGGYKPESALALVKVTTPVRTIAHWIPVTKRALSDAAQIRTLIDAFLEYGLEEELEDQMAAGDGTGENFSGLTTVSGTQSQAWDTDLLTTTRKAKTKVRLVGRSIPTGYLMHPTDVEALDLLTDNEARFYFGGPSGTIQIGNANPLWNLPIIETEAIAQGTAWVGDWRKAVLWDREQSSITMTDSHADFFIRNMVAILAELRAAFGILQPNAFVSIDLTA